MPYFLLSETKTFLLKYENTREGLEILPYITKPDPNRGK